MTIRRLTRWFAVAAITVPGGCRDDHSPKLVFDATPPATSVRMLYPPDQCVLLSDTLQIMAVGEDASDSLTVTVDGRPLDVRRLELGWTAAEGPQRNQSRSKPLATSSERISEPLTRQVDVGLPVFVAAASLKGGEHRISVGSRRLRLLVRPPDDEADAPPDRPVFRLHPPAESPGRPVACSACHKSPENPDAPVLGEPQTPDACFSCHSPDDFELTHTHRVEALSACQMCHDPHGGTQAALLKDEPKVLCSTCHE